MAKELMTLIAAALVAAVSFAQSPESVLDELHRAASDADHEVYFGLFTENAVFLGTDKTERWPLAEFERLYRPYMEGGRGWTYVVRDRNVTVRGDVAWFDERLSNEAYGHCRGSGVLERIDGRWKIAQYNLTFPVPNEIARDVVEMIREEESRVLRVLTLAIGPDHPSDAALQQLVEKYQPDVVGLKGSGVDRVDRVLDGYERRVFVSPDPFEAVPPSTSDDFLFRVDRFHERLENFSFLDDGAGQVHTSTSLYDLAGSRRVRFHNAMVYYSADTPIEDPMTEHDPVPILVFAGGEHAPVLDENEHLVRPEGLDGEVSSPCRLWLYGPCHFESAELVSDRGGTAIGMFGLVRLTDEALD